MTLPLVNCPDCNSLQRFAARKRIVARRIETYITCHQCGYETTLSSLTPEERIQMGREHVHLLRRMRRQIR